MPADLEPPIGDRRTRVRRAVRRTVLARRRPLAALCAGVAVVTAVHAVRPPQPPTVAVTVAARDLPSGTVLGRVVLPVRIADPDAVALLRVGDTVDLVAADPRRGTASYVAAGVPELALPAAADRQPGTATLGGRLVVLAALPSDVDRIAGASATDLLNVVISG